MGTTMTFVECFEQAYGHKPFPWQVRLADDVVRSGQWPSLLDLPTGTGKTAAIDVALFALAMRPQDQPRRIVVVVDRRVVVDQAAERARLLRAAMLRAPVGSPLARWRQRLLDIWAGEARDLPFHVAVLRGGMPRDEVWAARPDVPAVVVSTVDQVGSRLLFRGYGVSSRMAPVHAGLLGNDCLYLLDEVHLSTAFAETLDAIKSRWRHWHRADGEHVLPDRWAVVSMSATPYGVAPEPGFGLSDDDRSDATLSLRLSARKLATLEKVTVRGEEETRRTAFAAACSDAAEARLRDGAVVVAVVVNRVATARDVWRETSRRLDGRGDCVLLTGRMRPLDRMHELSRTVDGRTLLARIKAGRDRSCDRRPLVVVATQSIEAGADFDFDGLVTECASLDALRQRFGRLDRLGILGMSHGCILVRHDQIGDKDDDPVYGRAMAATWAWLQEEATDGVVAFGLAGWREPPTGRREQVYTRPVHAPVLLPAHIEAWAQTSPPPYPDPDVALWLHGPRRDAKEVQIVWRADVDTRDLVQMSTVAPQEKARAVEQWRRKFELLPPSSLEAMSVPLPAARAWLQQTTLSDISDVEGVDEDLVAGDSQAADSGRAVLHVARSGVDVVHAVDLRPGMTLVVPVSYGGLRANNWDPSATEPVTDVAELAQLLHRGRVVLRLDPPTWLAAGDDPADASWRTAGLASPPPNREPDSSERAFRDAVVEWLGGIVTTSGPFGRAWSHVLTGGARCVRVVESSPDSWALVGSRRLSAADVRSLLRQSGAGALQETLDEDVIADVAADGDEASFVGSAVALDAHLKDVAALAERLALNLGFPSDLVHVLERAGRLHDVGKADVRFQQWLAGGSEVRLALQDVLLAKSSGEAADRGARLEARLRAGYPNGYRHELLSVAMVAPVATEFSPEYDVDLLLHLIASHHGCCRALAPTVDSGPSLKVSLDLAEIKLEADAAHSLARLDSGIAERYAASTERFGWWGLAWLETVLRLADHLVSATVMEGRKESDHGRH